MKSWTVWALVLVSALSAGAQKTYYLDCSGGNDLADGSSPQTSWKTLGKADDVVLAPGDSLLLRRGATCYGMLAPKGSGSEAAPVTLGAYGTGALPRVIGNGQEAALQLTNQQFWDVQDLDLSGSSPYGVHIGGDLPRLAHIHLRDLLVHDVPGQPKRKESGLVVIAPAPGASTTFRDVLVDGVTAYGTTEWGGIFVNGAAWAKDSQARGSDIVIRNSIVHDVGGDGIFVGVAQNVLIERNAAWNTGMQYTESIGTPDGIWEWMCSHCTVQYNEAFYTDSPGVDGGAFDIDFGNADNTVQYNFGHDSQGYCVSIFGAEGESGNSHNSVIRGNVCVNNGRSPRLAQRQGAIYLSTWDGGKLSGVQIYGNTVYWNPPLNTEAVVSEADIESGAPRNFRDNIVVSTAERMTRSDTNLDFSGNVYWNPLQGAPRWTFGHQSDTGVSALHAVTSEEANSAYRDPQLNAQMRPLDPSVTCATNDYFIDLAASRCGAGALSPAPASASGAADRPAAGAVPKDATGWTLLALLQPEVGRNSDESRSQMAVLQSMMQQFAALGLHIDVVPGSALNPAATENWKADWAFGAIRVVTDNRTKAYRRWWTPGATTGLVLFSPDRRAVRVWNGLAAFPDVELTLRSLIGTPPGMQFIRYGIRSAADMPKGHQ